MPSRKLLRALRSFTAHVGRKEHFVKEGELLPADHPVVKGREELFEEQARPKSS
jgi:hypothetical protein